MLALQDLARTICYGIALLFLLSLAVVQLSHMEEDSQLNEEPQASYIQEEGDNGGE